MWICELHFSPEQVWYYETKKKLKDGELPSLNLSRKSSESSSSSVVSRSSPSISKGEDSQLLLENSSFTQSYYFRNFADFKKRLLHLSSLNKFEFFNNLCYTSFKLLELIPKFEVFIKDSFHFTVRVYGLMCITIHVYGWMLYETHNLYLKYK